MRGTGDNRGPALDGGSGWRRHCWAKARKTLMGERIPVERVRARIRRAHQLGLSYPQYASILLGAGRDVTAFLFTVDGLHLRLARQLDMPEPVRDKLGALEGCMRVSFAPPGEAPEEFRLELEAVSGVHFAGAAPQPEDSATWCEARQAVRSALNPLKLPSDSVVMIGRRDAEASWASAGGLAAFFPSDDYFRIASQ